MDGYMYPETGEDEINQWEPQALLVQKASRPPPRLYTPPPKIYPKHHSLLIRQIGGALLLGHKNHLMEAKPGEISGIR